MEFVLLALCFFAVVGALLGKFLKDRLKDGLLLGVLLGPIGVVCVLFLKDAMRQCPECMARVPREATTCQKCRCRLKALPSFESSAGKVSKVPLALRLAGLVGFLIAGGLYAIGYNSDSFEDGMALIGGLSLVIALLSAGMFVAGIVMPQRTKRLELQDPVQSNDPIKVGCLCGAKLTAKPSMSGRRLKCPKCGQPVFVP